MSGHAIGQVILGVSAAFFLGLAPSDGHALERVQVALGKGHVMTMPAVVDHVAVGASDVADIQKLDTNHLYVVGKRVGTTTVVLCTPKDCFKTIEVEVTYDLNALREKLHELYPGETPSVHSSEGSIILSGQVSSLEVMNGMLAIAGTFTRSAVTGAPPQAGGAAGGAGAAPGGGGAAHIPGSPTLQSPMVAHVLNLLQVGGPQQVMLGVTVAEISRSLARALKVDFTAFGGGGQVEGGALGAASLIQALKASTAVVNPATLFFNFVGSDATVQTVIHAARSNGLVKILAEPNLSTISGQDAEFVSGGEFPIPVPQFGAVSGTGGGITVQFKEYGVILKFLPVVLNSGRISLKLNISVTEIMEAQALVLETGTSSYNIPTLSRRSAASSTELDDGQTLGIAGLISDRTREAITKFPGLGDIPILGQLFTSEDYMRNATELMIFVTPHLAKPVDPSKLKLPTDRFSEPDDVDFFLKGRTEGSDPPPSRPANDTYRYGGGLRGTFGQNP